jgi:predicted ribosomally synthesized peptide with SipW-like signal peptide
MGNRTLLGSLLLIGVTIAALAGGSYAIFTDTEAMHVKFQAGTIDIDLNGKEGFQEIWLNPGQSDDWKPGDHVDWLIDVHNKGSNKAWIQIYVYPTPAWDPGAHEFWGAATWSVEGPEGTEWNRWVLDPSNHLELTLLVDFPQSAGNYYQGAQGDLLILVVAKQYRNKFEEGYSCVALEDKGTTSPWLPNLGNDLEGIICFRPTGSTGELAVDLNAYGLVPGAYYQLDFTGGDKNNPIDGACTTQDANLAGMADPPDLYTSGYWNWGTYLEATCNAGNGGEGVWNYAGVYGTVQADPGGSISFGAVLTGLPGGPFAYKGIGAHVKQITGTPPGTAWTVILSEMDYLSFTIP